MSNDNQFNFIATGTNARFLRGKKVWERITFAETCNKALDEFRRKNPIKKQPRKG